MKKILAAALAAAIGMSVLAGCRPEQENSAALSKGLEHMLLLAASPDQTAGVLAERLGAPGRYESYVEDAEGGFKVTIDADVILPEADGIPLIRVEPQPFDQSTVDKLIEALFDGGKLYTPESLSRETKAELAGLLEQMKLKKLELERQGMKPHNQDSSSVAEAKASTSGKNEDTMSRTLNKLDMVIEGIQGLEKRLQNAPEEKEFIEAAGELKAQDLSGLSEERRREYEGKRFEVVHAGQLNEDGKGMHSLFVVNNEKSNSYTAQYINRRDFDMTTGQYSPESLWREIEDESERETVDALPSPTITIDQAQDIAEQFLERVGVDYLACERREEVIGGSSSEYADGTRTGNLLKAYRLQYVRRAGGVPMTYTDAKTAGYIEDDSLWVWDYERMTLIVDDSGIVEMEWEAPYRLVETVAEDASMLPFSEIQEVCEKMILIANARHAENGAVMNVTEVRLGLMRIIEKNKQASGLLVPVWDFFGTLTTNYEAEGQIRSYTEREPAKSLLTINAVDGSVIDRSSGY